MLLQISVTLQTEILSVETSDFLKQIIFLKSFNSVFNVCMLREENLRAWASISKTGCVKSDIYSPIFPGFGET